MSSLLVADEGMAEKTDEVAVVRALGEGQGLRIENVDLGNFINIINISGTVFFQLVVWLPRYGTSTFLGVIIEI